MPRKFTQLNTFQVILRRIKAMNVLSKCAESTTSIANVTAVVSLQPSKQGSDLKAVNQEASLLKAKQEVNG